jgi:hypothetical protein
VHDIAELGPAQRIPAFLGGRRGEHDAAGGQAGFDATIRLERRLFDGKPSARFHDHATDTRP